MLEAVNGTPNCGSGDWTEENDYDSTFEERLQNAHNLLLDIENEVFLAPKKSGTISFQFPLCGREAVHFSEDSGHDLTAIGMPWRIVAEEIGIHSSGSFNSGLEVFLECGGGPDYTCYEEHDWYTETETIVLIGDSPVSRGMVRFSKRRRSALLVGIPSIRSMTDDGDGFVQIRVLVSIVEDGTKKTTHAEFSPWDKNADGRIYVQEGLAARVFYVSREFLSSKSTKMNNWFIEKGETDLYIGDAHPRLFLIILRALKEFHQDMIVGTKDLLDTLRLSSEYGFRSLMDDLEPLLIESTEIRLDEKLLLADRFIRKRSFREALLQLCAPSDLPSAPSYPKYSPILKDRIQELLKAGREENRGPLSTGAWQHEKDEQASQRGEHGTTHKGRQETVTPYIGDHRKDDEYRSVKDYGKHGYERREENRPPSVGDYRNKDGHGSVKDFGMRDYEARKENRPPFSTSASQRGDYNRRDYEHDKDYSTDGWRTTPHRSHNRSQGYNAINERSASRTGWGGNSGIGRIEQHGNVKEFGSHTQSGLWRGSTGSYSRDSDYDRDYKRQY